MQKETQRFREKGCKLPSFAYSCWAILPSLLLAESDYLGISQQLSNTFKNCPEAFQ
jgi:hypothetical protein